MNFTLRAFLLSGGFFAMATTASATITVIANFRLGEADPGAVNGSPVNTNATNSGGGAVISTIGSNVLYSGNTGVSGSTRSVDFSSGGYAGSPVTTAADNWGMEAWVQTDSLTGTRAVVYNGNSANAGMGIYTLNGSYIGLVGGKAFVGGAVQTNAWTHLAMVVSSGVTTFYVNGLSTGTGPVPNTPAGNFNIGVRPDLGEQFDGRIDEVRVFTFAAGQFTTSDLQLTSVVPEPGAMSLLGLGLLVTARRRR
ncbi:MAG TPA: LamG-like jellyroll fold domain-containing protein [Verrucomicrobiales bacterium]|nr:LamG-like jellyroll fold domain-containing protein [Verrucomicrobiales bacterium]